MNPALFMEALCGLKFADVFNPYSDCCPVYDFEDAPLQRSQALLHMLEAAVEVEVDSLWIGRDLGYRGGRRTGLALTDDIHLSAHAARWGVNIDRPTKGQVVAERTAAVIWSMLAQINSAIFLWNVFPLHPHESEDPFTNRNHNRLERQAGEELLEQLISLLQPTRLIAIGNDAASVALRLAGTREVIQVRHPSYGGQTTFLRQAKEIYDIEEAQHSLFENVA